MNLTRIHYTSGIFITFFILLHLFNHAISIFGAAEHIEWMEMFRKIYRNPIVETMLLLAIGVQIFSGVKLFFAKRKYAQTFYAKLQIWTGLYLAFFLLIHVSAVLGGRFVLDLDTNFYFGVAGLNTFPFNLFFVPYYSLAILAFFGHIAAIHYRKMQHSVFGITPKVQSNIVLMLGFVVLIIIFYGLTNGFSGVVIPEEYDVLIGK